MDYLTVGSKTCDSERSLKLAQLASRVSCAMHMEQLQAEKTPRKVNCLNSYLIGRLKEIATAGASQTTRRHATKSFAKAVRKANRCMVNARGAPPRSTQTLQGLFRSKGCGAADIYRRARCLPSGEDRGEGCLATRKGELEDGFDGVRSSPGAVRDSGEGEAAHSNAG